ncbi:MAG TPA: alpha/beta hydrolase [Acetobacteraceae bacterium]|nr:alpha/beta hydrolase [Acetobacteraceae bacterium]
MHPKIDPDMRALLEQQAAEAAKYPPIRLEVPLEPHRVVNNILSMRLGVGGPDMADSADRWVDACGRRIFCRVHRPGTDRLLPALVYFHGGGWVWGSVDTHDRLAREYAVGGGVGVVNVDYALSPEARFPQAAEECAAVVRHVVAHGAEWGLDGSRILIGGDSAGGNLALATALLLRDTGGPALRGILASYPVCDSRLDTRSYQEFGTGFSLTREKMAFYWSVYVPHAADRLHPLAAPLRAELAGLPPVRVQLAELDVLRSEGEALADRLRAAAVPVEYEVFAGMPHGFVRATGFVQKSRDAMAAATGWMRRCVV